MSDDPQALEAMREKLRGTNINEQTLLATDYLNHLNEPIMLFEMLADVPELLDELAEWQPKSYVEHFTESTFTDKELAIEAYAVAPAKYREPFDETVDNAKRCIATAIEALTTLNEQGRTEEIKVITGEVSQILGSLVDKASSIIHGKVTTMGQTQIDEIMGT
jgi:hypothetical protein